MKRKLAFTLITILLLFPWTVAYAYDNAAASTGTIDITPAGIESFPRFNGCGNAIGGVTPGDIFTIDCTGTETDTSFTLCITNTDELIHNYRYMTLNIGVYIQAPASNWEKTTPGENSQNIYLTMQNGAVSFVLAGNAKYKVTVDKGCYYCYGIGSNRTAVLPDFYLTTS
jgi:hypothetical protein